MSGRENTELALVEGFIEVPIILGGRCASTSSLVLISGAAWSLPAHVVQLEFARRGPFALWMLRYALALMTEIGQTAVCNRHHAAALSLASREPGPGGGN